MAVPPELLLLRRFLLSFYFQIPTGFYPLYPVVSTVAINDNNHHCILSTEFANKIHPADQYKTAFTTLWGTFAYRFMPLGLKNAGATF
jgi:hypothetical protein